MGIELSILQCGLIDADRSVIHPGDDSHRRVMLPVMALFVHGERTILIDTGCPLPAVENPDGLHDTYDIDPTWIRSNVAADERIDVQLAKAGVRIQDLDLVIGTHFHFDHAGGNALFAGQVPIAVQEAEILAARESEYLPVWDAPGLQFQPVRGDWSPMPGVEMLWTPGHTAGHQSVLLRLENRPWLFTVDAVYTEEHWRQHLLGAVSDVAAARTSVERLRALASRENARLIFGHDMGQWDALERAPHRYR
ncbi:MAG: N-acyl homoserine lactonase family protein [Chloroflexota bacterium]